MGRKSNYEKRLEKLPVENFKYLIYYCPNLKKEIKIGFNERDLHYWEGECDLCGGHGEIYYEFDCICGKIHKIEIKGW